MTPRPPATSDWRSHHDLGPGAEFDVVRALLDRWGSRAVGIGDDAAVLDLQRGERLVVSTDASVENVHFRREWLTPREIGYRATASALSDLAAMGARPLGVVVAIVLPPEWRTEIMDIGDGIGDAVAAVDTAIVGGDLSAARELAITVTVLGAAVRPVGRDGARPGDGVYVTGRLGGPRRALHAFECGAEPDRADRDRFARPAARIGEGQWLATREATAMIDVSDGLAADLRHVATASGVVLRLEENSLPRVAGATAEDALSGGEEYELALTARGSIDVASFERAFGVALTRIGLVEAASDGVPPGVIVVADGRPARVDHAPGHDHFSPSCAP